MRKTRRNELELAGFRSTAIDAWLGHDDETAKKHYSRVTDTDFERGSQLLTIGKKGNAEGNSYEAIRGHIAPNEKKEQLKPRENDTVASSVPSEMTPTGLEETSQTWKKRGLSGMPHQNPHHRVQELGTALRDRLKGRDLEVLMSALRQSRHH